MFSSISPLNRWCCFDALQNETGKKKFIYNLCLQLNWKHWGNYSVLMLIQFWMITWFLLAVQVNAHPLYSDYCSASVWEVWKTNSLLLFLVTQSNEAACFLELGIREKVSKKRPCLGWFKSFEFFSPSPWICHRLWNASLMLMSWVTGCHFPLCL